MESKNYFSVSKAWEESCCFLISCVIQDRVSFLQMMRLFCKWWDCYYMLDASRASFLFRDSLQHFLIAPLITGSLGPRHDAVFSRSIGSYKQCIISFDDVRDFRAAFTFETDLSTLCSSSETRNEENAFSSLTSTRLFRDVTERVRETGK